MARMGNESARNSPNSRPENTPKYLSQHFIGASSFLWRKQGFASTCLGAVIISIIHARRIWKDPEVTILSRVLKVPELNCRPRGCSSFWPVQHSLLRLDDQQKFRFKRQQSQEVNINTTRLQCNYYTITLLYFWNALENWLKSNKDIGGWTVLGATIWMIWWLYG